MALNNLSFLLQETDPEESLQLAKQASSLAPQSAELKDTLAMALLKSGDLAQARKVMDKVLSMRPDNPTFRYHKAMILDKSGEREAAASLLKELVEAEIVFPAREEARALYRNISGS